MGGNGKEMVKTTSPSLLEELSVNRPHDTELAVDPHVAQWAVRTITRLLGLSSAVLGIAILLGGEARFMAPSYEAALAAPGAPWSWGLWSLTAGIMVTVGTLVKQPRLVAGGAWIGASWCFLFATSFFLVFQRNPEANNTAMCVYSLAGLFYGLVGGAHYAMAPLNITRRVIDRWKARL